MIESVRELENETVLKDVGPDREREEEEVGPDRPEEKREGEVKKRKGLEKNLRMVLRLVLEKKIEKGMWIQLWYFINPYGLVLKKKRNQ